MSEYIKILIKLKNRKYVLFDDLNGLLDRDSHLKYDCEGEVWQYGYGNEQLTTLWTLLGMSL